MLPLIIVISIYMQANRQTLLSGNYRIEYIPSNGSVIYINIGGEEIIGGASDEKYKKLNATLVNDTIFIGNEDCQADIPLEDLTVERINAICEHILRQESQKEEEDGEIKKAIQESKMMQQAKDDAPLVNKITKNVKDDGTCTIIAALYEILSNYSSKWTECENYFYETPPSSENRVLKQVNKLRDEFFKRHPEEEQNRAAPDLEKMKTFLEKRFKVCINIDVYYNGKRSNAASLDASQYDKQITIVNLGNKSHTTLRNSQEAGIQNPVRVSIPKKIEENKSEDSFEEDMNGIDEKSEGGIYQIPNSAQSQNHYYWQRIGGQQIGNFIQDAPSIPSQIQSSVASRQSQVQSDAKPKLADLLRPKKQQNPKSNQR